MFGKLFSTLHYLIGLVLGILLLPIAYIQVFFPLGIALAVVIWPTAFATFCVLGATSIIWLPALTFCFIALCIVSFCIEVASSLIGTVRDAFRQPPQHPQPFYEAPALASGIPASRSDSMVGGSSLPPTPGADGAVDVSSWLEKRFAGLSQRNDHDDADEHGLVMSGSRGPRSYPPRRSSSVVAASSSSVNTASTLGYSTASVNSTFSTSTANRSNADLPTPASPVTPTRRRSRTKSMSFDDGSRPGLAVSHSTTSMVTGSPRVSSQHEVNSSMTSLVSNPGSAAGSIEGAAESLRVGQLVVEASEDNIARH